MRRGCGLLFSALASCAPVHTTTTRGEFLVRQEIVRTERTTEGEPMSAQASLQGDTVQMQVLQPQRCVTHSARHVVVHETTTRTVSRAGIIAEGASALLWGAFMAALLRDMPPCSGGGCAGEYATGVLFASPAVVGAVAFVVDLRRSGTTTMKTEKTYPVQAPAACEALPVAGQPLQLLLPGGQRFAATTGPDGQASVRLGDEAMRALQAQRGRVELWVGQRPVGSLKLPMKGQP